MATEAIRAHAPSYDAMRAFLGLDPAALGQLQPLGGNAYAQLGAYTIIFWAPAGQPFVFDNANHRFASGSIGSIHVKTGGVNGQLIFTADPAGDSPELFDAPTFWDLLRDRADGLPGASTAFLGLWEDRAFTYNGADGRDYMGGSGFADTFYDVGDGDEVRAGGGSDTINVYGDVALIDGGFGDPGEDDVVRFFTNSRPEYIEDVQRFEVINSAPATIDLSVMTAGATVQILTDVGATVVGTRFVDDIQGNNGADILHGGDGEDILKGGEGNDDIRGGDKNDELKGEGGDDTLRGDKGADTIDGGEGQDTAVYDFDKSSYYIKRIVGTLDVAVLAKTWQVRDSEGWNGPFFDTLRDIENIEFAGESVGVDVQLALSWITETANYIRSGSTAGLGEWATYVRSLDLPQCLAVARALGGTLQAASLAADFVQLQLQVEQSQNPQKALFIGGISLVVGELATVGGAAIGASLGVGVGTVPLAILGAVGGKVIYDQVFKNTVELFLADVWAQFSTQTLSLSENAGNDLESDAAPATVQDGRIDFDEEYYLDAHPDVRELVQHGQFPSAYAHFVTTGIDLGYQPNAAQSITRDQLAFTYSNAAAFHYSAPFAVAIGQYAGDGVSSAEQSLVSLVNANRTTAPALALDANLSALAHRKAVDLIQNWPVNAVSEAQNQPDSGWAALWSTNQSFRDAFKTALESVIGASANNSAFKVLVGVSQNGSAGEALSLLNQKSESGALTDQFDTVGVAEYGGIWVLVLADRESGYVPTVPDADTLSNLVLYGTDGADLLYAGTRTITAHGSDWVDQLVGGAGNDTLEGGSGVDALVGGNGMDTASYASSDVGVTVNLTTATASGGHAQGDTLSSIENLTGSAFADVLVGDGGVNTLEGGAGQDSLYGLAGGDVFKGGADADYLAGGDGGDTLYGQDGNDTLDGGADADYLGGGAGTDSMYAGAGNDVMQGGEDADYLDGNSGADTMYGDAGNDVLDAGADLSADADYMDGGDGHDTLYGRGGNDTMIGGVGFDALYGDAGADYLFGGEGNDYLGGQDGGDFMQAGNGDDSMDGGGIADYMEGEAGADSMYGGDGGDVMHGGADNDFLNGQNGSDTMYGGGGNDVLDGGSDSASDYLDGGALADAYIFGAGMGNDVIGTFDDGGGAGFEDYIYIDDAIVANFATLSPAMSQNGANVIINLGGFGGIQINGVTLGNLGADDFIFY